MKRLATKCSLLVVALLVTAGSGSQAVRAQLLNPGTAADFNPQPDPPGFGLVGIETGETIHLNVTCFEHQVGTFPPGPCRGRFMFHNAAGDTLTSGRYDLKPGQSTFLTLTNPAPVGDVTPVSRRLSINPCILPAPGSGPGIPSVEVFDAIGHVRLFENPAVPAMSNFSNGFTDPGSIVGFNPQPDPPGFGLVTVRADQVIRLNVTCFEHPVGGVPPGPCSGEVMFHDATGAVVARGSYDLKPGEARALRFEPPPDPDTNAVVVPQMSINPCILPAPGGRVVPNVEVVDIATRQTALLINPATARMSGFNHNETLVRDVAPSGRDQE